MYVDKLVSRALALLVVITLFACKGDVEAGSSAGGYAAAGVPAGESAGGNLSTASTVATSSQSTPAPVCFVIKKSAYSPLSPLVEFGLLVWGEASVRRMNGIDVSQGNSVLVAPNLNGELRVTGAVAGSGGSASCEFITRIPSCTMQVSNITPTSAQISLRVQGPVAQAYINSERVIPENGVAARVLHFDSPGSKAVLGMVVSPMSDANRCLLDFPIPSNEPLRAASGRWNDPLFERAPFGNSTGRAHPAIGLDNALHIEFILGYTYARGKKSDVHKDGSIVLSFNDLHSPLRGQLYRMNRNGGLDSEFGFYGAIDLRSLFPDISLVNNAFVDVEVKALRSGHTLVSASCGGGSNSSGYQISTVKITRSGVIDLSFGQAGRLTGISVTDEDEQGRLMGVQAGRLVRLDSLGILDPSFQFPTAPSILFEPRTGYFYSRSDVMVLRHLPNGVIDRSFSWYAFWTGGYNTFMDDTGLLYKYETFTEFVNSKYRPFTRIYRLRKNGEVDWSFGGTGSVALEGIVDNVKGDRFGGVLLVMEKWGRTFLQYQTSDNQPTGNDLVRLTASGVFDPQFGTNGKVAIDFGPWVKIRRLHPLPDGSTIVEFIRSSRPGMFHLEFQRVLPNGAWQ